MAKIISTSSKAIRPKRDYYHTTLLNLQRFVSQNRKLEVIPEIDCYFCASKPATRKAVEPICQRCWESAIRNVATYLG